MIGGKRRDMGLGAYPGVPLADAQAAARTAREKIRAGVDPIAESQAARSALQAARATALTFEQCATRYIEAHEAGWRNGKHANQWRNTLRDYVTPHIGRTLVRDVGMPQVLAILEPIWHTKTETASRVRGRIECVLDWAIARGYRDGPNPARWRGHLDKVLPKRSKIAKPEHHPAMPVLKVGAFLKDLRKQEGIGARALEFLILTAARSGEVRGATWAEIDLRRAIWTVPAKRMKAGKEHRVPLSPAAVALLKALPHIAGTEHVFPAPRGGQLSDMTLTALMRRMGLEEVPHGFRSTFRDWCGEHTNFPRELAEMALAHTLGSAVEAAYLRSDLFEKRRQMMEQWAKFCARSHNESAKVVALRRAK